MPGTFSQLYVQVVFAVGGRQNLIAKSWSQELYKYMSGIITAKNQKSIIVNGMPDHIHIFIGLRPSMAVSDLVRDVKNNSTNFINERHFRQPKVFLAGRIWSVFLFPFTGKGCYDYILNQEEHHAEKTFKEEYIDFLKKFEIQYDEKYLFDWMNKGFQQNHP